MLPHVDVGVELPDALRADAVTELGLWVVTDVGFAPISGTTIIPDSRARSTDGQEIFEHLELLAGILDQRREPPLSGMKMADPETMSAESRRDSSTETTSDC